MKIDSENPKLRYIMKVKRQSHHLRDSVSHKNEINLHSFRKFKVNQYYINYWKLNS